MSLIKKKTEKYVPILSAVPKDTLEISKVLIILTQSCVFVCVCSGAGVGNLFTIV